MDTTKGTGAPMTGCVIRECPDPVDLREVVEMSIPERPYKALRRACPGHLEMFRAIGLPVIRPPELPTKPIED